MPTFEQENLSLNTEESQIWLLPPRKKFYYFDFGERENSFEQGVTDQTLALTVFGSTYIYYTAGRYYMTTFFLESPPVTIFVLPGVTVADSSTPTRFKNVL